MKLSNLELVNSRLERPFRMCCASFDIWPTLEHPMNQNAGITDPIPGNVRQHTHLLNVSVMLLNLKVCFINKLQQDNIIEHVQTALQCDITGNQWATLNYDKLKRGCEHTRLNCRLIRDCRSASKRLTKPAASAFCAERYRSVTPCIEMHRNGSIL